MPKKTLWRFSLELLVQLLNRPGKWRNFFSLFLARDFPRKFARSIFPWSIPLLLLSLLCLVSKVLERCVLSKPRHHLLQQINNALYGFIPGRSCTTQLVEVFDHIGPLLDTGKQTDLIFMDMPKAFDKVSHIALINRLSHYKISGTLLDWFRSYLQDRPQCVTTLGASSSGRPVTQEFLRAAY